MTWTAWVRIDGFERGLNALLLTDGFEEGAPHWQLSNKGEIILRSFNGRMDELALFGQALGPDEIQRLYASGKPSS